TDTPPPPPADIPPLVHSEKWRQVRIGAGGQATQVTITVEGVVYLGTDGCGAYRWDATALVWGPIGDLIGLTGDAQNFGTEAIGLDPNSPGAVWLYVGTRGNTGALYKSTDYGESWIQKNIPGLLGDGNGELGHYKGRGPKIAVDPRNSNVVYVATINLG